VALALLLAGCGGGRYRPVADWPVRVGPPYAVRGVTYVPAADPTYDMLGLASWYGNESGNRTANGEKFRAKAITGAHATLPLPSYVEVTALGTGHTILVRVNDRGPFVRSRILDLSRGAAEELGVRAAGPAQVGPRLAGRCAGGRPRASAPRQARRASSGCARLACLLARATGRSGAVATPGTHPRAGG